MRVESTVVNFTHLSDGVFLYLVCVNLKRHVHFLISTY